MKTEEDYSARNYVLKIKSLLKSSPAGSVGDVREPGPYLRKLQLEGDLPDPFDVDAAKMTIKILSTAAREVYEGSPQKKPRLLFTVRSLPGLAEVAEPLTASPLRGELLRQRMRRFVGDMSQEYSPATILILIAQHPEEFIQAVQSTPDG